MQTSIYVKSPDTKTTNSEPSTDIAIIGMSVRLPGARNIDAFWANLVGGKESIKRLSDEELLKAGVSRRDIDDPDYVKSCPVLDDIDKFDAAFFGLSPRDASVMDPAHRFFLEVAWEALEHSGNTGLPQEGRVGVFATSGAPLYWMNNVRSHQEIMASMGEFLVRHTSNDMNFLATRLSYDLDLRGPSINVQTACSSSLVAAHLARQSLLAGECDMALIGGSTINNPMGHGYHFKEGEILSPDGHCRPFDHRSAGTVFGSGTACLILKRLDDAFDNGDTIHAVIKGSAVNNDGSQKVSFLAPGVDGQVAVIKDALNVSGVSARSITYVEAHGTGTSVGDPIELTALDQAFSEHTSDKQFCAVGSVKSNIGHLGEAAAAASMIKVVLALKNRLIPPSLGYERPNPRFPMAESPFFVNSTLQPWSGTEPLRAGITALGAGGTNCHLILEEPPAALPGEGCRPSQLICLSAKTAAALNQMSENLASCLEKNPDTDLADVAYTLSMGRRSLPYRRVLVAHDHNEAIALLHQENPVRVATTISDPSDPDVVFTFPGGGAQYARMGIDLYENEPAYRAALDECIGYLDTNLQVELRSLLFAAESEMEAATQKLERPSLTLPTLFAVEYSLARLFESYGLHPVAYIGHSMGEYVAACLSGVFSLRDGLRLVCLRGRLFETTKQGNMIGVSLSETDTRLLMPAGLSIAAVNSPELCVASGPSQLIDEFSRTLSEREIDWTPIHIDVAAHSSLLDPILGEFRAFCNSIVFHPPHIPIASNLTGRWLTAEEAMDPEYWVKHLRNTVRFSECVETVLKGGNHVFLEIGPGRTLTTLTSAQETKVRHAINSVRHPKEPANDVEYALISLGKVWAAGTHVDWTALYDGQIRNRVPLPTYPFEGQSYWVEPKAVSNEEVMDPIKRDDISEWFSTVNWEQAPLSSESAECAKQFLIFSGDVEFTNALSDALSALIKSRFDSASHIVVAKPGAGMRQLDHLTFEVRSGSTEHYRMLFEQLKSEGRAPDHVVLLIGNNVSKAEIKKPHPIMRWKSRFATDASLDDDKNKAEVQLESNFFVPAHLGLALSTTLETSAFTLVTWQSFSVCGEDCDPWARLSVGPALVIPHELPDFPTRLIDLGTCTSEISMQAQAHQLARELLSDETASPVVLRTPTRWAQNVRPARLPKPDESIDWLDDDDVLLITGGLGGIGLVIAEHLASKRKLSLALMSRDGLPPSSDWGALLKQSDTPDSLKHRISSVQRLVQLGARVLAVRGDVTDRSSLTSALAEIRANLGPINALIHAAGVMDDELLHTKSDDKMHRVLAPKVLGTHNLDALLTEDLKAFVMMSSIASLLGLPGQIDYTAANAFLDGFAEYRQKRKPGRTLVINWNAWRDVGMIVDVTRHANPSSLPAGRPQHPWLDASEASPTGHRYFTDFGVDTHWLLAEHQIRAADALIPGTGFVELARAAYEDSARQRRGDNETTDAVELHQVTFLSPFQIGSEKQRRLQINVDWNGDSATVTLSSDAGHETHMTAQVRKLANQPSSVSIGKLIERCTQTIPTRQGFLDQDFVVFGPRWKNLDEIRVGKQEAVIRLTLDKSFSNDLGTLAYHPALLDMATGAAQNLIPGFKNSIDFLVPFGYDCIRIFRPVAGTITSHVQLRPGSSIDIAIFDVSIVDATGAVLVEIDGFTMKRVNMQAGITQKSEARSEAGRTRPNHAMEALLREAITKHEGVIAFDRALKQTETSRIVASSVDVNVWLRKLARDSMRLKQGDVQENSTGFSRPALSNDYVKPENALEISLCTIWAKLLGVTDVGVTDDFFELGGNSLVAVRFFARVKKEFGVSLPLSTLFQAPTIRTLTDAIRSQGYSEESGNTATGEAALQSEPEAHSKPVSTSAEIKPPVGDAALLIRAGNGKPPLFFVHDGLGEVLLYRNLALRLNSGYPVYGLEPEAFNGRYRHTRIFDMARAKIERVQKIQPSGPYLIAGLCAGGVIAFEMARQLEEAGEKTIFVGIIDAADVHAEERKFRIARARIERFVTALLPAKNQSVFEYLGSVSSTLRKKILGYVSYNVSKRLERSKNRKVVATMRNQETPVTDTAARIDFIKLYEVAHQEHEPSGVYDSGDVVLFRATQSMGIAGDQPFFEIYSDPLLGWGKRVQSPVIAIDIPGGHSSALQEPHVESLAKAMQDCIDRAMEKYQGQWQSTPPTQGGAKTIRDNSTQPHLNS